MAAALRRRDAVYRSGGRAAAATVASGDPLVGSRLKATIPVVVSEDVELVEGDWDILSVDGAG
eukprot:1707254-Prymnesium_polylepis.1